MFRYGELTKRAPWLNKIVSRPSESKQADKPPKLNFPLSDADYEAVVAAVNSSRKAECDEGVSQSTNEQNSDFSTICDKIRSISSIEGLAEALSDVRRKLRNDIVAQHHWRQLNGFDCVVSCFANLLEEEASSVLV